LKIPASSEKSWKTFRNRGVFPEKFLIETYGKMCIIIGDPSEKFVRCNTTEGLGPFNVSGVYKETYM
jgi:hypothetical protein